MNRRNFLILGSLTTASIIGGALYWPKRWRYIVIHHSAGDYGNIEFIQKVHRQRQKSDPIDAIPYHFLIGNGNGMGMGEVASDWRWQYQLWGAHVSANNLDRDFRGIGICLIGNLEKDQIPQRQYDALVELTRGLMSEYDIPIENISGHGYTKGESTKCPGKNFPMTRFLLDLSVS